MQIWNHIKQARDAEAKSDVDLATTLGKKQVIKKALGNLYPLASGYVNPIWYSFSITFQCFMSTLVSNNTSNSFPQKILVGVVVLLATLTLLSLVGSHTNHQSLEANQRWYMTQYEIKKILLFPGSFCCKHPEFQHPRYLEKYPLERTSYKIMMFRK